VIHKYLLYSASNIISEDQAGRTDGLIKQNLDLVGLPATVQRVTNLLELSSSRPA